MRRKKPDLRNVTVADLKDPWRLAALFKQARLRGWVRRTEAQILSVFAAAVRALRDDVQNPCGLFVWLVSKNKWEHVTCEDEDRGRSLMRQLLQHAR